MLVITGTGRCGTSLLAEFCRRLGYDVGGSWNRRSNAGLEHPQVVRLNEGLAVAQAAGEPALEAYLAEQAEAMRQLALPVVKDPRFVSLGTAAAWLRVRSDLRWLVCLRPLASSVKSARRYLRGARRGVRREGVPPELRGFGGWTLGDHCRRTRWRLERFAETLREHAAPVATLRFPEFTREPARVVRALGAFGGLDVPLSRARDVWAELVDPDLVHFCDADDAGDCTRFVETSRAVVIV